MSMFDNEKGYISKNGKYKYWLFNKFDERKS